MGRVDVGMVISTVNGIMDVLGYSMDAYSVLTVKSDELSITKIQII